LLFAILEAIALFLAINGDVHRKATFLNSANSVSGYFAEKTSRISEYFNLQEVNQSLAFEHARLYNLQKSAFKISDTLHFFNNDTLVSRKYFFTASKVIKNSTDKQFNYLTLDKGSKQGITNDMAVIAPSGVVGVTVAVSENYSVAISLLNRKLGVSAKLRRTNYFGSVRWEGKSYRQASLSEIPIHVQVEKGDTIVTSGYSAMFPEDIPIGVVKEVEVDESGHFHKIGVWLATDFKSLQHIYIVTNLHRNEQTTLEKMVEDD